MEHGHLCAQTIAFNRFFEAERAGCRVLLSCRRHARKFAQMSAAALI
jgi:hypothetical protein